MTQMGYPLGSNPHQFCSCERPAALCELKLKWLSLSVNVIRQSYRVGQADLEAKRLSRINQARLVFGLKKMRNRLIDWVDIEIRMRANGFFQQLLVLIESIHPKLSMVRKPGGLSVGAHRRRC